MLTDLENPPEMPPENGSLLSNIEKPPNEDPNPPKVLPRFNLDLFGPLLKNPEKKSSS